MKKDLLSVLLNAIKLTSKLHQSNNNSCMIADNIEWMSETPKTLWKKITDEVKEYYGFNIKG